MSVVTNGNTTPMATQEEDPPDNDKDASKWKTCNGENNRALLGNDEGELLTSGGRPLNPDVSYIFLKNDLMNVARLEDFDQEKIACGFFSEVYKVSMVSCFCTKIEGMNCRCSFLVFCKRTVNERLSTNL